MPEERIAIVPNHSTIPIGPCLRPRRKRIFAPWGSAKRPFFLHVGGNQWYKNRPGVLRLFAGLIERPAFRAHRLVMAGKPWTDEMRALCAELELDGRVDERVEVSNEQLRALYTRAEALLFPSLSEGFGWPIAEAQACGCPVVTTNRPPMTEVGGEAAIYIDPADPTGAAGVIGSALTERERWRMAGLENAARFSTSAMVAGYVACYDAIAGYVAVAADGLAADASRRA
jgi:glycosyltransferase involved in cell wall biosynthesis